MASRAPNGSSISRTSASCARARASATRWRMPPDSSCGRLSAKPVEVHQLEQLVRPAPGVRLRGTPAQLEASSMLPATVSHGNSAASWNIERRVDRRRSTVPAVGWSRPATRLSSVLLPQPEAPTRHTNSPGCARRARPGRGRARASGPSPKPSTRRRSAAGPGMAGTRIRGTCATCRSVWRVVTRPSTSGAALGEEIVQEARGRRCR